MAKLISVEEARAFLRSKVRSFDTEAIPLSESLGRVLKEDWYGDRDLPPYDRVTMDGIAVSFDHADFASPIPVAGMARAGDLRQELDDQTCCLEVMTGAVMPIGTDTVIRYEDIEITDQKATVKARIEKGKNVHYQGLDRKKGDLLVSAGQTISAAEVGVGASIGKSVVKVSKVPRCIVISTGDELVEIDERPLSHQIRRGNVYRIMSILRAMGLPCDTDHLQDDLDAIQACLEKCLKSYDVIILSGGVSKGKLDFVPDALKNCGVEEVFHKITQRPGKPMWFGTHESGATVFGLPGNPVSSFMCFNIYVLDWLRHSLGQHRIEEKAMLGQDVLFKPNLTYFLEVSLTQDEKGRLIATPHKGNGSGDLANLTKADAFIELPKGHDKYEAGSLYPIHRYR